MRVGVTGSGGPDALANPFAFRDRRCAARRNPGGICAIADHLSMVRQGRQNGRWINILLLRQLPAMHDDPVRHWRVLLSKPVLPRNAGQGSGKAAPSAHLTLKSRRGSRAGLFLSTNEFSGADGSATLLAR